MDSPEHYDALSELNLLLHQSGILRSTADRMALGTIRRQMDVEAIASAFQDSFLFICMAFLLASLPMVWLVIRHRKPS
jgi:hypothetical protein